MSNNPLYIACDDSGFELKSILITELEKSGIKYVDCGSDDEPSRYPYYAARVASAVSRGTASRGILICGSGVGMCIAANKYPGVRAALISDSYSARLTRRHNDSNILCLGGRTIGPWAALEIMRVWLNTEYDAGHHDPSLALIREMEQIMMTGVLWLPDDLPYPKFTWNENQPI